MSRAIFEAFATAADVGRRIDRLVLDLGPAFVPLKVEYIEGEEDRSLWAPRSYTAHAKVPGLRPRQKEPGQLALHFDLVRPPSEDGDWPWSDQALVVIGYALNYEEGWLGGQMTVEADGRLGYEATAPLQRFAGNRLLATAAPASGLWVEAEWAYAVPFDSLDDAGALRREIVAPVTDLLVLGANPDHALAHTSAIAWSEAG